MDHLITLFDFERGPDVVATLAALGFIFLVCAVVAIWVDISDRRK